MDLEVYTKAPSVRFLGISDRCQIPFPQKVPGHKTKIRKREREDKKHQHEIKHFVAQRELKLSNVALRTTAIFPVIHTEVIRTLYIRGEHVFKKSKTQIKILGARRVT